MALCPFATHKLIDPGSNDPRIKPRVAILHVDAGGAASLFSYFRYRSGGIESHFHIRWTGAIEQYRDTDWQADANYRANDFAVSIETQGFGGGKWNRRQLASVKRLLLWLNAEHGIPLQRCPQWDGAGVGYHIQFGSPGAWTNVAKSCPGPQRIDQYDTELVPWMLTNPQEDDVPYSDWPQKDKDALVRDVVNGVMRRDLYGNERDESPADALRRLDDIQQTVLSLRTGGLDVDAVADRVVEKIAARLDAEGN